MSAERDFQQTVYLKITVQQVTQVRNKIVHQNKYEVLLDY